MDDYIVSVSNAIRANSPEDAVAQMAAWLVDYAYEAGYRVESFAGDSVFIDAETINFDEIEVE